MVPIAAIIQASQQLSDSNADRMLGKAMDKTNADGIQDFSTVNRAANRGIATNILTGNLGKAIGLFGQKRAIRRQIRDARNKFNQNTMDTLIATDDTGLKDGGKVKDGEGKTSKVKGGKLVGRGGPKEDAIPATLNKGDVVIPADADSEIVSYILKRIGLDKPVSEDTADSGEGKDVNLSNHETIIPASMVGKAQEAADELGISLADLMPDAQASPEEGGEYATGLLGDPKLYPVKGPESTMATSKTVTGKKYSGMLKSTMASYNPVQANVDSEVARGYAKSTGSAGKDGKGSWLSDNADTLIGAAQMGVGAAMAAGMGKRPDADVSGHMSAIAKKVTARRNKNVADYKAASDEAIETKRRMGIDNATRMAPGAASAIGSAQEANSQWASDKNEISKTVAAMSNDGISQEAELEAKGVEMKQRALEDKQAYYDKKADAAAKLIGTGMQNTIDSIHYKRNRKALEKISDLSKYDALLEALKKK